MIIGIHVLILDKYECTLMAGMSEVGTRILRQPSGGENHCGTGDFEVL